MCFPKCFNEFPLNFAGMVTFGHVSQCPSHGDNDEFPPILWGAQCMDGCFLFNGNKGVPVVTQHAHVDC